MNLLPPSDPRLWTKVPDVTDIAAQVRPYVADMRRLVIRGGYGLGATQVGVPFRFFVMRGPPLEFVINPRWWACDAKGMVPGLSDKEDFPVEAMVEGCLTWPDRWLVKGRFSTVHMKWTDPEERPRQCNFHGIMARVIQHECDHLDGGCIFPRPDGSRATDPALVGLSAEEGARKQRELLLAKKS